MYSPGNVSDKVYVVTQHIPAAWVQKRNQNLPVATYTTVNQSAPSACLDEYSLDLPQSTNPAHTLALLAFLGWFLFITVLFWGCGSDTSSETWPPDDCVSGICYAGTATDKEWDALYRLAAALESLGYSGPYPTVIFVRSPGQAVPRMCGDDGCCDVWADCPDALGTAERVPGEGFSGLQRGGHIFISRIGDRAGKLDSLLAHEFSHAVCDCGHSGEQKAIELELRNLM